MISFGNGKKTEPERSRFSSTDIKFESLTEQIDKQKDRLLTIFLYNKTPKILQFANFLFIIFSFLGDTATYTISGALFSGILNSYYIGNLVNYCKSNFTVE